MNGTKWGNNVMWALAARLPHSLKASILCVSERAGEDTGSDLSSHAIRDRWSFPPSVQVWTVTLLTSVQSCYEVQGSPFTSFQQRVNPGSSKSLYSCHLPQVTSLYYDITYSTGLNLVTGCFAAPLLSLNFLLVAFNVQYVQSITTVWSITMSNTGL